MQINHHLSRSSQNRFAPASSALFVLLLVLAGLLWFSTESLAAQVTLAWDAPTQSGIAGYKVYWRTASGSYQPSVSADAGNILTYTVPNLNSGTLYYFVATSYLDDRTESGYSNEVYTTTASSVNTPPVANNLAIATSEDVSKGGMLTGSDAEGNNLTFSLVANGSKGSATIAANGSFTYTPNANANGTDSFTFKVNDGTVDSSSATVTVTINAVNDAPVANVKSITTNEDTPVSGTLTGSDPDGNSLNYSRVANGSKGSATIAANGSFTYTPNANANGADSFTFKVNDGTVDSSPATVTVTINAVNDAPVANIQSITTNEDTPVSGTLTGSDPDGNSLTYSRVANGSKGSVTVAANGSFTYTPNANANGADSFTFKVNDGTVDSSPATVTVTINAVNDAPVANIQSITTNEDTPVSGALTGSDPDGNSLTYSRVANGSKGSATIAANGSFTYTPNANANGTDSFTFKVNDGTVDSSSATVTVNINAVNDAPVANIQSITTNEDTPVSGALTGSDPDGNSLTYSRVANGSKGSATIAANGSFTYTPNANANGTDSFTFKVNDGTVDSSSATVTVNITPVNDAPVAQNGALSVNGTTPTPGTLAASDADSEPLTYSLATNPTKGSVTITNATTGAYTYTASQNASGADTFTFKASDGKVASNAATISVTITMGNRAPVAQAGALTVSGTTAKPGNLVATDADSDPLTYSLVTGPTKGTISISDSKTGAFSYTAKENTNGADTFTFKANDGKVDSNVASVSVTITAANHAPVAQNGSLSVNGPSAANGATSVKAASPATGTLVATDADSDPLTFTLVANPGKGTVAITDAKTGAFSYTANANTSGADTFTFKANDSKVDSNVATVTVTISAGNRPPVANNGSWVVMQNAAGSSVLNATDEDKDPLSFTLVSNAAKGSVEYLDSKTGTFIYRPKADATGSDSFTFKANDGKADSNAATVAITIAPNPYSNYENAEDGSIKRWTIIDKLPKNAKVINELDAQRQSRVIRTKGYGTQNAYRLRKANGTSWHNTTQRVAQWSLKYSEYFEMYFEVNTTAGTRTLTYTPVAYDKLGAKSTVYFGIGAGAINGQWHTFTRDLEADLDKAQPGVQILEVNALGIRGNVSIDEVKLLAQLPALDSDFDGVPDDLETNIYATDPTQLDTDQDGIGDGYGVDYWGAKWKADADGDGVINLLDEDADNDGILNGTEISQNTDPATPNSALSAQDSATTYANARVTDTTGWDISSGPKQKAQVDNVVDPVSKGRVIELSSPEPETSFRLRNYDLSDWHNSKQFRLQWNMQYAEDVAVMVSVYTTAGERVLCYTSESSNTFGDQEVVRYGLGRKVMSGKWRLCRRNLQADLQRAQPDVQILEVNNVQFQGRGKVNDIKLLD